MMISLSIWKMTKRLQNRVADSRLTLPLLVAFSLAVWVVSGLLIPALPFSASQLLNAAWVQFACFMLCAYLMAELNNSCTLIRIYSPMVAGTYLAIMCAGCFLFPPMPGAIAQLCAAAFYIAFFRCYQDKESAAWNFYAFLCLGLASTVYIQVLVYVPFLWLLMYFRLTSLSRTTFCASLFGLLLPYWFALPIALYHGDFEFLTRHFTAIATVVVPPPYSPLTLNQLLFFAFLVAIGITGTIHYWRSLAADSIRTRQFFRCFIAIWLLSALFTILQPQHYDLFVRIMVINIAPLIAHFLSLTHTRATNIAFIALSAVTLLLTIFSLWKSSYNF